MADESFKIRDRRMVNWFWVDNAVVDAFGPQIGPYGLAVYVALCRHAGDAKQTCWPSLQTIADETGMSRAKAYRTVHNLRDAGLIAIVNRASKASPKERDSSLYVLLPVKKAAGRCSTTDYTCSTTDDTGVVPGTTEQSASEQNTAATATATPTPKYGAAAAVLTSSQADTLARLKAHGVARNAKVLAVVRAIADKPGALEAIDDMAAALKRNKRISNFPGALVAALEAHDWTAKPKPAAQIVGSFEE